LQISNYFDRIIILPFLGAENVAIYFAAASVGKLISFIVGPISNVLLSYIVKVNKLKLKFYYIYCGIIISISFIFWLVCFLLSFPIVKYLYPQLYSEASSLFGIVVLSLVITYASNFINPIILRFGQPIAPIKIQGIRLIFYIFFFFIFIRKFALIGFCLSSLFSSSIQLLYLFFTGRKIIKNSNLNET
jgi:O-antigen/teichoic acid export membrane protein